MTAVTLSVEFFSITEETAAGEATPLPHRLYRAGCFLFFYQHLHPRASHQVYHKIPVGRLLEGEGPVEGVEDAVVRGRRLSERLAEPGCRETCLVALRLMGRISADVFERSCQETGGKVGAFTQDSGLI